MYFDAKFLDGTAVVYLLPVTNRTTFDDYAHQIFIPHVIKQLENTRRVDVVWDTYIPNSINESIREGRGFEERWLEKIKSQETGQIS